VNAAVIINPISGTGGRPDVARRRAEFAAAALEHHRVDGEVFVTERIGHARELTRAALARGARLVLAWGGDGTVNEVASVLAYGDGTLGIIPSGSGNGLSRELQIPFAPDAAFDLALASGRDIVIDAGELDEHLFFNIAGIGLDARVAHRFAAGGLVRRGFWRYLEITAQEIFTYAPDEHTVVVDNVPERCCALIVAIANARQYGNGAIIAPAAKLDDGRLDVVVVAQRSIVATLFQVRQVFRGRIDTLPGVSIRRGEAIEVTSARPVIYHIDGEPFVGGASVRARVRPSALRVRVPTRNADERPATSDPR
jgi:YegS/Rv2252/BmrU family lipid kinase